MFCTTGLSYLCSFRLSKLLPDPRPIISDLQHFDACPDPASACNFDAYPDADPDPTFRFDPDPDPTFHLDADPCESGSETTTLVLSFDGLRAVLRTHKKHFVIQKKI